MHSGHTGPSVFVPEKPETPRQAGELDGREIDEGGYLGDRSIRRARGGVVGVNWIRGR